ncbi:hypothetical protein BDV93DRAFT_520290 [Ceratobasidium sp. AG-I]|nr:hypothetical protein BDV93DRAFT_520290 [Ceratobasidium sp. AG-I]
MNPRDPTLIHPEIHLMILESFLSDKSLYSSVKKDYSYTSVSKWIGLALVCRAWRNRIHAIAFRHLRVRHKVLAELRDIAFLSAPCSNLHPATLGTMHTPTLNYVYDLTWSLKSTDYLPEAISILAELPHLNNLTIKLYIPDQELNLGNSTHPECIIPQVKRLRIRLFHPTCGIRLERSGVRWILSGFPCVEHLYLDLPCTDDYSNPDISLNHCLPPNLISLVSTGCSLSRRFVFFEIWDARIDKLHPFADYHGNTLEGLRFIRMIGDGPERWCASDPVVWGNLIPKFHSLRYLSMGNEDVRGIWLEPIKSQHLCHFEFAMSRFIGLEEMAAITKFVTQRCPNLQVLTYHDEAESAPMQELEGVCSLSVIQKPMSPSWPPEDECAYGYTCWEDIISPDVPFPPVRRR